MSQAAPPPPPALGAAPVPALSRRAAALGSDTARAAGLAGAQLVATGVSLVATVVFARLLGTRGYGEYARATAILVILLVPAMALQVAAARETALGHIEDQAERVAALARRERQLLAIAAGVALAAIALRHPLGSLMRVHAEWAAAAVIPTGCLWAVLAVQRGTLQGIGGYRPVGVSIAVEQGVRLTAGALLAAAGLGVTGAFIGAPVATALMALWLAVETRRRLGPTTAHGMRPPGLRMLVGRGWAPIAALTLFAVVQNVDVVVVGHTVGRDASGAYAVAAVAAKGIVWVSVGLGLWLLPEATRRGADLDDVRPLLRLTLGLLAPVAIVMVGVYAVAGHDVLAAVFGGKAPLAASALPWLGAGMSLLACSYLATQFLLAVGRVRFIGVLAVAAALEPLVIVVADSPLRTIALALLGLQLLLASLLLGIALRGERG